MTKANCGVLILTIAWVLTACGTDTGDAVLTQSGSTDEATEVYMTERGANLAEGGQYAVSLAVKKAEELGYDLQQLLMNAQETEEGGWRIQFDPRSKTQRGGNLTVHISGDGKITQVQRWR